MLEVAVLYGCDLSQVFTPIILRLYQPHSLCEKGATRTAAKAALVVFLLPPLREGRPFDPAEGIVMPKFLLAPLREGRLREIFNEHFCLLISTRAPTRGATAFFHKTIS